MFIIDPIDGKSDDDLEARSRSRLRYPPSYGKDIERG